jgi:hypothetical protein
MASSPKAPVTPEENKKGALRHLEEKTGMRKRIKFLLWLRKNQSCVSLIV